MYVTIEPRLIRKQAKHSAAPKNKYIRSIVCLFFLWENGAFTSALWSLVKSASGYMLFQGRVLVKME